MENKNNVVRWIVIAFVVIVLMVGSFGGGFVVGHFLPIGPSSAAQESSASTPSELQPLFTPFWEAWNLVHQQYVDQPVDDTKLMEGAINGMMQSLGDPYTSYMTPEETQAFQASMQGYDGIGAYVDVGGEYLTITVTFPGYPAESAGLRPGDQIIAVDGQDVTGMDPDLVRQTMVLGKAGTNVHLTIKRQGEDKPLDFDLTRAHIEIPTVTSKMLENQIAYIKINYFSDNTTQDLQEQLSQLLAQNPKGLILDLRDNPGGYLDQAVSVASEFIPSGVILYEQYADGTKTPFEALSGGQATEIPMVVLVNEYSASASEIVAGAIQDNGRGKLIGMTTFGKGLVQSGNPLSDGGTAKVTIAKWLTPDGRIIHKTGLTPDVVVTMTQEDYDAGKDPQLDEAVRQLLNP